MNELQKTSEIYYQSNGYAIDKEFKIIDTDTGEYLQEEEFGLVPADVKAELLGLVTDHTKHMISFAKDHIERWNITKTNLSMQLDEWKGRYLPYLEDNLKSSNYTVYKQERTKDLPLEDRLEDTDYVYEIKIKEKFHYPEFKRVAELLKDLGIEYEENKTPNMTMLSKDKIQELKTTSVVVKKKNKTKQDMEKI